MKGLGPLPYPNPWPAWLQIFSPPKAWMSFIPRSLARSFPFIFLITPRPPFVYSHPPNVMIRGFPLALRLSSTCRRQHGATTAPHPGHILRVLPGGRWPYG
jgi:hypothetical protein